MMLAVLSVVMYAGVVAGAGGRGAATLASPALFAVETTVLVNDVARNDRELGYRLKARLMHRNAEYLPRPSLWDDLGKSSFFAHWEGGTVLTAYLDSRDPLDVLNYKKSIISLFQFNSVDGDYKETDVSGDCNVLYETISETVFRKTKEACACDAAPAALRRVARYTLAAAGGPLAAVHAEELATVGDAALGLKARAWHALAALPPPAAAAQAPSLEAALAALPAPLAPAPLPLTIPPTDANADADDFDDHLGTAPDGRVRPPAAVKCGTRVSRPPGDLTGLHPHASREGARWCSA
ncbi:hypothetical protein K1T71_010017 [Dendrolimus kikuchii]|uniref:Uncharacterized protein n=1 Tax=Dendrolimus kikuchii TaxID=765133 RepID=A0ACC1CU14_9NEOP|nr:hypothetical protein K1T71_010017 [Dendrolimus kikuchii]